MSPSSWQEPHLHGLLYGINDYKSDKTPNLASPVHDVNDMVDYFHHDLGVPREQLTIRLNSDATRSRIISDIVALGQNPLINQQDPIVVYFSGAGCRLKSPAGDIQALLAHDSNTPDSSGEMISAISRDTIHVLLEHLALLKGNNIVRATFISALLAF